MLLLSPFLLPILSGCYSYSVVPPESAVPGTEVRARITAVQADRLSDVLMLDDRVLTGTVVAAEPDELLLEVSGATVSPGRARRPLHQRIALPFEEVLEVEVRRLNTLRTAGVALGGAIIIGVIAATQLGDDEEEGTVPPDDDPNALRVPVDILGWLGAVLRR